VQDLRSIVGHGHVITGERATERFRTGYRFGCGTALAVVRPGTLVQMWQVLESCITARSIVIPQASNTGLTGGSTPFGSDYDRDVVIISTTRLKKVQLIRQGAQVICHAGATLHQLERLLQPLGREPHSVLGSSCLGATVIGGLCNNSGGALTRRGPVYTELALFAHVDENGRLHLVNHLDVELGNDPIEILGRLDNGLFSDAEIGHGTGRASNTEYQSEVRNIDADTPARFNANPRCLHEAAGSAGKVLVFAARFDTFEAERNPVVYYIGSNRPDDLTAIRRALLGSDAALPIAGEYMHRDAYDLAKRYGKDTFLLVRHLGTARLPWFFELKGRAESLCRRLGLPRSLIDRLLQSLATLWPRHLPARMGDYRSRFEHYLVLKVAAATSNMTRRLLDGICRPNVTEYFECSADEAARAFLHRFAVAGAAVRYRAIHPGALQDIVALDIALRRNDRAWFERLPADIQQSLTMTLYYGHFLCHVFHQDYLVKPRVDIKALKDALCKFQDSRGAEYPAEHNVGHLYPAKPALARFYEDLDPTGSFNPGIGQLHRHT
jgi:D-lactate dehydrogenase